MSVLSLLFRNSLTWPVQFHWCPRTRGSSTTSVFSLQHAAFLFFHAAAKNNTQSQRPCWLSRRWDRVRRLCPMTGTCMVGVIQTTDCPGLQFGATFSMRQHQRWGLCRLAVQPSHLQPVPILGRAQGCSTNKDSCLHVVMPFSSQKSLLPWCAAEKVSYDWELFYIFLNLIASLLFVKSWPGTKVWH